MIIFHEYSIIEGERKVNRQYAAKRKMIDIVGRFVGEFKKCLQEGVTVRKSDARARYTEHALKTAFLKLLREKPVNKITVKEVCESAELNRATFYTHYSDCFALLSSIEQELTDAFGKALKPVSSLDVSALIEAIYMMIDQNEEACRVLIFDGASPSVLGRMIDLAKDSSIKYWRERLHRATEDDLEMLYVHLSNGLMNVVVGGYDKYRREDVIRFVNEIVKKSLSLYEDEDDNGAP